MGEFSVKKMDTYILMEVEDGSWSLDTLYNMADDLQAMNGGMTVVARQGQSTTLVLDGYQAGLNPDRIGEILDVE